MMYENTTEKGFILLRFSEYPDYQVLLFFRLLIAYSFCVLEKLFLIVIVCLHFQLHTPMYFFICNLSFLDISLTTLIYPKSLLTFLNMRSISFYECMAQLYLYIAFQSLEFFLLTVMSYDRYVAICNPLRYNIILNKNVCVSLSTVAWMFSLIVPAPFIQLLTKLNFCKLHTIDLFFCDSVPLLKLSCESIRRLGPVLLIEGIGSVIPSFLLTLSSYISIISVILKIQSTKGRKKAFSTCSAHLTVVSMLYVTLICIYFVPPSSNNYKTASLLTTFLIPILNPLLYSLRNKDIKNTLFIFIKHKRVSTK